MVDPFFRQTAAGREGATGLSFDAGLRAHMQRVFNYMAGGLALTGLIAFWVAGSQTLAHAVFGTPLQWLVMLAPLGFVFYLSAKFNSMSVSKAQTIYWLFAATMGLSMAAIFLVFTGESIARVFFITSATFAGMSLLGYTTRADLTGMGSFMLMGLLGIMLASIVNLFMASAMLQWVISIIGVVVFTGLTAYDVQKIKHSYAQGFGAETNQKLAIIGALELYLDFINLFRFLLSFMGDRR